MRGHGAGVQELQEFRSSGVQEFRSSGVQEFRSSGVQEFRSSGVQEFIWRKKKSSAKGENIRPGKAAFLDSDS
jgi:hypothetical protein